MSNLIGHRANAVAKPSLGLHVISALGWLLGASGTALGAVTSPEFSVMLAWDPSPVSNIVKYTIYYGNQSGAYNQNLSVGTVTNATVTGLRPGRTYFFVATATDSDGLESEFSNEVNYVVPVPLDPLGVQLLPGGRARVSGHGNPGSAYVLMASHDLVTWQASGTGAAGADGLFQILDESFATNASCFYRVRSAPP